MPTSASAHAIRRDLSRAVVDVAELERTYRAARDAELDALAPSPEVIAAMVEGARTFVPTTADVALDDAIRARREAEVLP